MLSQKADECGAGENPLQLLEVTLNPGLSWRSLRVQIQLCAYLVFGASSLELGKTEIFAASGVWIAKFWCHADHSCVGVSPTVPDMPAAGSSGHRLMPRCMEVPA